MKPRPRPATPIPLASPPSSIKVGWPPGPLVLIQFGQVLKFGRRENKKFGLQKQKNKEGLAQFPYLQKYLRRSAIEPFTLRPSPPGAIRSSQVCK